MHVNAKSNEYADAIMRIYNDIPKAVLAAIAVSALTNGGDNLNEALERVANEWLILWCNKIVPQKPPAKIAELACRYDVLQAEREDMGPAHNSYGQNPQEKLHGEGG